VLNLVKVQRLKPDQIGAILRQIDVLTTSGKTLAKSYKKNWTQLSKVTIVGARSMVA